jgi:hypothetical protein
MKIDLIKLIGSQPSESPSKKQHRFHQGWWRTFVLAEEPGPHPMRKDETLCNTLLNGRDTGKNFLSQNIANVVKETMGSRPASGSGIMAEERLFNNLLSSQPLCFNFFGELKLDPAFALQVLKSFYPKFTEVKQVFFEFAPAENDTHDNSAFDVAFEVMAGNQTGLLGLECKYTDTFSSTVYDKEAYQIIFNKSETFAASYPHFIAARYNQLFRNQLMAEALVQNGNYDFVLTGLFCHPEDEEALAIGAEFQGMLRYGNTKFRSITYQEFIENIQKLDLTWERRELSMLLWARYCGLQLSQALFL